MGCQAVSNIDGNFHYQVHFPLTTAECQVTPIYATAEGGSEHKRLQLTLTSAHVIVTDLIQLVGPLLVKWLPMILGGLLDGSSGNEPAPPSPPTAPTPQS